MSGGSWSLLVPRSTASSPRKTGIPTAFEIDENEPLGSFNDRDVVVHAKAQIRAATSHQIPMLPAVAQRALSVAGDPDVSIRSLAELIEPDAPTTARVLAIANGPLYAPAKKVTNLKSAMMLLGVGLVRDILYQSVAEAHIFRGASAELLERHRLHGAAVGHIMRGLSRHLGLNKDFAFLSGLLHDIGTIILRQMLDRAPPVNYDPANDDEILETLHAEVGHHVCQRWGLPAAVAEVANRHHTFEDGQRDGYSQLGHVAAAAERLAAHVGLSSSLTVQSLDGAGMFLLYRLGLDEASVDAAIADAEKVAEHVRSLA